MKKMLCLLALLLPLLLCASLSQELLGADSLSVGSAFSFVIHADAPISKVILPDSLDNFAILDSKAVPKQASSWQIKVAPLKTGAQSFPRLQVLYAASNASPDSTDGFRVFVLSIRAEADTLLRDIKPMQRYPLQLPFWLYLLLFVIALLLGLYLLLGYIKKSRLAKAKPMQLKPVAQVIKASPAPKAWQTALQELDALCAEMLLEQGELVQYHFRLSEILRRFLEASYAFPALEMTQSEISAILRQRNISKSMDLQRFLIFCDMAKFAKASPKRQQIDAYTDWLRSYFTAFCQISSPPVSTEVPHA